MNVSPRKSEAGSKMSLVRGDSIEERNQRVTRLSYISVREGEDYEESEL